MKRIVYVIVIAIWLLNIFATTENFKVEIIQNGTMVEIKNGKAKLEKAPMTFVVNLPLISAEDTIQDIHFLATTERDTYKDALDGKTIKELLRDKYFPYAVDPQNSEKFIVVGENGYNLWYYSNDSTNHSMQEYHRRGSSMLCKIEVENVFLDDVEEHANGFYPISKLESKRLYLFFEITNAEGKVQRSEGIQLKFK